MQRISRKRAEDKQAAGAILVEFLYEFILFRILGEETETLFSRYISHKKRRSNGESRDHEVN